MTIYLAVIPVQLKVLTAYSAGTIDVTDIEFYRKAHKHLPLKVLGYNAELLLSSLEIVWVHLSKRAREHSCQATKNCAVTVSPKLLAAQPDQLPDFPLKEWSSTKLNPTQPSRGPRHREPVTKQIRRLCYRPIRPLPAHLASARRQPHRRPR